MNRNFSRFVLVAALGLGFLFPFAQRLAAESYSVPVTWSGMTMLNVSYSSSTGKLSVVDQGATVA